MSVFCYTTYIKKINPTAKNYCTSTPIDPLTGILIEPFRSIGVVIGLMPSFSKLPILLVVSKPNLKELDLLIKMSSTRNELDRPLTNPGEQCNQCLLVFLYSSH